MDDYINGLENMHTIIKGICDMSREDRTKMFGASRLDIILDRFDFLQIKQIYDGYTKVAE